MACPAAAVGAAVLTTPASSVVDVSVIGGTTVYHNYEHHLQSIPTSHPDLRLTQFAPADAGTRAALGLVSS